MKSWLRRWWIKAAVQKFISFLPWSHKINFIFQRHITRGARLNAAYFEDKITHFRKHRELWDRSQSRNHHEQNNADKTYFPPPPESVLELGTGWFPVVPVAFWLIGVDNVVTCDLTKLCRPQEARETIKVFLDRAASGQLLLEGKWRLDRIQELESAILEPDPLQSLGIRYVVGDAARLRDNDSSFDLIVSNNVLEHVSQEALPVIFSKFGKLLKPRGISSHFIDLSDHFAHLDKNISVYHFLRYSPAQWKWIDNPVQPQNRLRVPFFRKLFEETGHKITEEEWISTNPEQLREDKVHFSFQHIPPGELAVYHVHYTLQNAE